MNMKTALRLFAVLFVSLALLGGADEARAARDAAFLTPGYSSGRLGKSEEAVTVEPKSEIDLGETAVNVSRRATFFFVNMAGSAIDIESITANGDSNVRAEIVGDDCSKEKKILAASRCSVTVEVTPAGSGSWTAEVLMTHKAAGRITRARIAGKTSGSAVEKRDAGLSLNTKDFKPVDFGDVEVGTGKAVRTALMVNDSSDVITILSVEIIAADNGLQKLDQGCSPDMDLKVGESCPITIVWRPESKSNVSTDLIIRHSGRLGFAVIPIRGTAKEEVTKNGDSKEGGSKSVSTPLPAASSSSNKIPMSPTADELDRMIQNGKLPKLSEDALPSGIAHGGTKSVKASASPVIDDYHLIGTVGNRAVIYKPDGTTAIVAIGEEIAVEGGGPIKVINVGAKDIDITYAGKKKSLKLEAASALTQRAAQMKAADTHQEKTKSGPKQAPAAEPSSVPLPAVKP